MTLLQALLLGIIQGVTEFLPVSSSGHLVLGQIFLGFEGFERYILFDLVCHMGTLFAIVTLFYRDLLHLIRVDRGRLKQVFVALLPLFPLLLLMKPIKEIFAQPSHLWFFFGSTALLLYLGVRFGGDKSGEALLAKRWRDAFLIGLFQAYAIFPGVSRSGATISGARLLGWSREEAVKFSFIIAIPTILGGSFLEFLKIFRPSAEGDVATLGVEVYLVGFFVSLGVGYLSLKLLVKLVMKDRLLFFALYCLALSLFCFFFFTV